MDTQQKPSPNSTSTQKSAQNSKPDSSNGSNDPNDSCQKDPNRKSRLQKTAAPKRLSLLKSTGVVSFMTMLSRFFGFARDMVLANLFGANASTDAFFVAFKIPNFLRRLFAEGAFAQAFVPVLNEYKTHGSHSAVQLLLDRVAGTLGLTLVGITSLFVIFAPWIIYLFAPGFADNAHQIEMAGRMLQITFPYLLFVALTAFAGGILNSYNKFAVPAFTPVILNIVLISSAFMLTPYFAETEKAKALAWGVFIAGALQLAFQIPFLWKLNLLPKPKLQPAQHEGISKIFKLMLPALFGVSVSQINLLIDTILASTLAKGSVSWLYYSDRLMELPLGVFGIAVATVILPSLSRQYASKSVEQFNHTLNWAIKMIFLIALPASVALMLLAEPLLISLFNYGEFGRDDVVQSAASLRAYSMGVLAFMLIKVLAPGFFARQDTKTPVKIGIVAMVVNMLLNFVFYYPLAHAGLALATTLSAFVNSALLYWCLRKAGVLTLERTMFSWLAKVIVSVLVMVLFLWFGVPETAVWFDASVAQRAIWILGVCAGGALVYFVTLLVLGVRFSHLKATG